MKTYQLKIRTQHKANTNYSGFQIQYKQTQRTQNIAKRMNLKKKRKKEKKRKEMVKTRMGSYHTLLNTGLKVRQHTYLLSVTIWNQGLWKCNLDRKWGNTEQLVCNWKRIIIIRWMIRDYDYDYLPEKKEDWIAKRRRENNAAAHTRYRIVGRRLLLRDDDGSSLCCLIVIGRERM